MTSLMITA